MKRILAITMTTILLALSMTACGSAGSSASGAAGNYIGTWAERDGETDEVTSTKFIKADDLAIEWPSTEIVISNE